MNKIPPAHEFFEGKLNMSSKHDKWIEGYVFDTPKNIHKIAIEFAKAHVKLALEAAADKAKLENVGDWNYDGFVDSYEINKDSILTSYPLENIQ